MRVCMCVCIYIYIYIYINKPTTKHSIASWLAPEAPRRSKARSPKRPKATVERRGMIIVLNLVASV